MANIIYKESCEIFRSTGECIGHGKFIDTVIPYKTNILQTFCTVCNETISTKYLSADEVREHLNQKSAKLVTQQASTHKESS